MHYHSDNFIMDKILRSKQKIIVLFLASFLNFIPTRNVTVFVQMVTDVTHSIRDISPETIY